MSETALVPMSGRGVTFRDVSDIERFATLINRTSFVPAEYRGKVGDCIAVIAYGLELGLNPMQSLQNIAFVNGKPSVYGDMLLALVRTSGMLEWIRESAPHEIEGTGKAVCEVKRKGEEAVTREFTQAMAEKAGLWKKSGVWASYPSRMLQMRARSWALRDVFSDVLKGLYAREEAEDISVTMGNVQQGPSLESEPPSEVVGFLVEEIGATLKRAAEGASSDAKERRRQLIVDCFGVNGWRKLTELPLAQLQVGYAHLQELITPVLPAAVLEDDDVPLSDLPEASHAAQVERSEGDASGEGSTVVPDDPDAQVIYASATQLADLSALADEIGLQAVEEVAQMQAHHQAGVKLELYRTVRNRLLAQYWAQR